jgi:hypothetical protein
MDTGAEKLAEVVEISVCLRSNIRAVDSTGPNLVLAAHMKLAVEAAAAV